MSTTHGQRRLSNILSSAILLGFACPAMASIYHADGRVGFGGLGPINPLTYTVDLGVQAGGGVAQDFDQFHLHAQANSEADGFGVHAHAFAQILSPPVSGNYTAGAISTASATFSDVKVSGLGSGPILTSLNMNLSGGLLNGINVDSGSIGDAETQAVISVFINGTFVGSGAVSESVNQFGSRISNNGMLSAWSPGNTGIVTPSFTVQSGVPFEVKLILLADANTIVNFGNGGGGTAEANTDFSHTLTFALNGPIFNLPEGFTVNSVDAHIANNQSAPVPIPNSLALMACAMFCFSFLGIRNKGQSMVREGNDRSS